MLRNFLHPARTRLASLVAAAALVVSAPPLWAQDADPVDAPAQVMPLAGESLLLDVIRLDGVGFIAVGERGHVLISEDGIAWEQAASVPTRSTLSAVTGRGRLLWAAGHDSAIIHSEDGGRSWSLQYFDPDRQQPIMDIHFSDASNGIAIGAYGLMLVTADGGATWEDHFVSDEEWHLNALLDRGEGRLFIAGEAGFSYRSEDGGETWDVIEMPYPGSMFGVVASGDCLLVFGLRGHAQESCDDGESWSELDTGTEASLSDGLVSASGATWLAGNRGALLRRAPHGAFEVLNHTSGVDFAALLETEPGHLVLVGEDGLHRFTTAASGSPGP